jgi:hypothetical protein
LDKIPGGDEGSLISPFLRLRPLEWFHFGMTFMSVEIRNEAATFATISILKIIDSKVTASFPL